MRTVVTYSFSQLEPYINWVYFYHAWSLNGKPESERQRMKAEALDTLRQTEDCFKARAIIGLYPAWGDGDDIVLDGGERIPLLRQQHPAIGYPSMPDTSLNFVLDRLLHFTDIGIRLTESGMMTPHASVSGLMISHPEARYFDLGKIGDDQLADYAHRRGIPITLMRKFLESNMIRQ